MLSDRERVLDLDAIRAHCGQAGLAMDVDAPVQRGLAPAKPERKPSARRDRVFELFRGEAHLDYVAAKTDLTRATVVDYLTEFIRAEKPASIFPWVTRANTNLTSIMIGERVGEWLRTDPARYGL